jgi:beta-1,2-mannobiose phosphorylase / 1,2-beta-oligomannan phosphorylase
MFTVERSNHNPILKPDHRHPWEAKAVFNWSPVIHKGKLYCVYRAQAERDQLGEMEVGTSTIGCAVSRDGVHFKNRRQLIMPEEEWEKYGCEDPRITKIGSKFYIFYTALSKYPFEADGIKVAVAITRDLQKVTEKHLVTPFNAKAMTLFPEKINGKFMALLTANTDRPPAKIALAQFNEEEDMWSQDFWGQWYEKIDDHTLDVQRDDNEHVEVGAAPIKTKDGWLCFYSHIQRYFTEQKVFGIEALLLDLKNPQEIIGRTKFPVMIPEMMYEKTGQIPNVVFPSGSIERKNAVEIFYGATDNTCCKAEVSLSGILTHLKDKKGVGAVTRSMNNPIIEPLPNHDWEARATFNPAAINCEGKTHILYRAMSMDNTSTIGYAASEDGLSITERLDEPVYAPREDFEKKIAGGQGNSGCEDPRVVLIGNTIYMTYTAYDGVHMPRVAVTTIRKSDFIAKNWNWSKPTLISPPGVMDKNTCIIPKKINGRYLLLHRIETTICGQYLPSLNFEEEKLSSCIEILKRRPGMWDGVKVGITAPPIETDYGWLLLYHGVSERGEYRVGAAMLDSEKPTNVLARTAAPIMEPIMEYEQIGQVNNVVFPCGTVRHGNTIFIYYGGADSVVGVATVKLTDLINMM